MLFRFVTKHACDRQMNRRTDGPKDRCTIPKIALAMLRRAVKRVYMNPQFRRYTDITGLTACPQALPYRQLTEITEHNSVFQKEEDCELVVEGYVDMLERLTNCLRAEQLVYNPVFTEFVFVTLAVSVLFTRLKADLTCEIKLKQIVSAFQGF